MIPVLAAVAKSIRIAVESCDCMRDLQHRGEEVIDSVIQICVEHGCNEVWLFGSRAKGNAGERSDIDIALSGADDFDTLKDEVERIETLFTIDLVDMDCCRNKLLMEDITHNGRKIYTKV